jgi:hypothetical protein
MTVVIRRRRRFRASHTESQYHRMGFPSSHNNHRDERTFASSKAQTCRGEAAAPTLSGSTQVSVGFSSFSAHVFDIVDCIPREYFCA